MPIIEKVVEFNATPDEVFSIIENVEGFVRYSVFIKDIKKIDDNTFEWIADFFGVHASWTAQITENKRPEIFRWESLSGIYNSGSYFIEPVGDKTRVTFTMEYKLGQDLFAAVTGPVIKKAMDIVSNELMENINEELQLLKG